MEPVIPLIACLSSIIGVSGGVMVKRRKLLVAFLMEFLICNLRLKYVLQFRREEKNLEKIRKRRTKLSFNME